MCGICSKKVNILCLSDDYGYGRAIARATGTPKGANHTLGEEEHLRVLEQIVLRLSSIMQYRPMMSSYKMEIAVSGHVDYVLHARATRAKSAVRLRVRPCTRYAYRVPWQQLRAYFGYGYGRTSATDTGVLQLRIRAYFGYGYGRTMATATGVER